MSLVENIWKRYKSCSLLLRFIYINIAVFVLLRLIGFVSFLFTGSSDLLVQWVEMPSEFHSFLLQPWTLITYMFSHFEVLHILFNMLWLYWLGRIFLEFFNPRQLGGLYVLGGIGGAALYLTCFNLIPRLVTHHSVLIGASASVLAIVAAIALYRPDYRISLLFIGGISLKWIAIITIFIVLISLDASKMGEHIAHLGGILVGLWFGVSIKRGHDITSWINRCIDAVVMLFKKHSAKVKASDSSSRRSSYNYQKSTSCNTSSPSSSESSDTKSTDEAKLDEILGKLKQSGYGALTEEEREYLFNASRKRF